MWMRYYLPIIEESQISFVIERLQACCQTIPESCTTRLPICRVDQAASSRIRAYIKMRIRSWHKAYECDMKKISFSDFISSRVIAGLSAYAKNSQNFVWDTY